MCSHNILFKYFFAQKWSTSVTQNNFAQNFDSQTLFIVLTDMLDNKKLQKCLIRKVTDKHCSNA